MTCKVCSLKYGCAHTNDIDPGTELVQLFSVTYLVFDLVTVASKQNIQYTNYNEVEA